MKRLLGVLCLCLVGCCLLGMQTMQQGLSAVSGWLGFFNLDDSSSNWSVCVLPGCNPGGAGTPTGTQTYATASPSKDGNSSLISCAGVTNNNCLFPQKPGFVDSATSFVTDAWIYVPSLTSVGQLEYDTFQAVTISATLQEFMWGSQCNYVGGFWQIWNQGAGTWNNTSITCTSVNWAAATWHHYVLTVHRVPGDTSCAGAPCQIFDTLQLDGVTNSLNTSYPSSNAPGGWVHVIGTQVQINLTGTVTATENLDLVSLSYR